MRTHQESTNLKYWKGARRDVSCFLLVYLHKPSRVKPFEHLSHRLLGVTSCLSEEMPLFMIASTHLDIILNRGLFDIVLCLSKRTLIFHARIGSSQE